MKRYRYYILFAILLGLACFGPASARRPQTPVPQQEGEFVPPELPEDYADSSAAAFYYTEGVKRAHIYADFESAMAMLRKAMETDSLHAPSYFEAANTLGKIDPPAALEYSLKANTLDSTNIWYKAQLGEILILNKQYVRAQRVYEELIALDPQNPDNYGMLAALYEYTRQPFSAIAVLDKAETVFGKMEQLSTYKRELLVGVNMFDKAILEGQAIVELYPHNYESYLSLARLYAQTGKDSLAVFNFDRALTINPGSVEVLMHLNDYYKKTDNDAGYLSTAKELLASPEVEVEIKMKWLKEAIANRPFYRDNYFQLRELAANLFVMYPGNYEILELYARTLISWGDFETALVHHKAFLSDTLTTIRPFFDVVEMEAYLNRPDSVRKYTDMAIRLFPDNPELYIRQSSAFRYMKEDKKALKALDKALKVSRTDSMRSVVLGVTGDFYHENGNDKKAFENYRKALKYDGDNVLVLNNYAYYLSELDKELSRALNMAERAMELEGSNPTYLDTYGWVLYKLGRFDEAKTAIRQAIALDPDHSKELLLHYGDILYALGDNYMATVYWQRALDAGYDPDAIEKRLQLVQ